MHIAKGNIGKKQFNTVFFDKKVAAARNSVFYETL